MGEGCKTVENTPISGDKEAVVCGVLGLSKTGKEGCNDVLWKLRRKFCHTFLALCVFICGT